MARGLGPGCGVNKRDKIKNRKLGKLEKAARLISRFILSMRITQNELKKIRDTRKKWTSRQVERLYKIYRASHFGSSPRGERRAYQLQWPIFEVGQYVGIRRWPNVTGRVVEIPFGINQQEPGRTIYRILVLRAPRSRPGLRGHVLRFYGEGLRGPELFRYQSRRTVMV